MMLRFVFAICIFGMLLTGVTKLIAQSQRPPIGTIELLHTGLRNADAKLVSSLLHEDYHGISLQGPHDHRQIHVETRAKAISDVAGLHSREWDVRLLSSSTQIDSNGMAHVWARYVFYFKGTPNHCGHESYVLYQSAQGWKVVSFADTDNPLQGRSIEEVCPIP